MDDQYDITFVAKACSRCGASKPLSDFNRNKGKSDGRESACRQCTRAAGAAYRSATKAKERCAAWRAANPDREAANGATWRGKNKEKVRAYAAAWWIANKERVTAHRAMNPDIGRRATDRHRARMLNAPIVEVIDRATVWERDGGRCHICGRKADPNNWHLDHIVALAAGGEHSYRNVAVSHPTCNRRKGSRGQGQLRLSG